MRNPAKRDDRSQVRHRQDRLRQKGAAVVDFRRLRLILRRHAADSIGDCARNEPQAVIGPRVISSSREAVFNQRPVKKIAREIAREGPSRAVGAIETGRQTDHQQPRINRSKKRNRRIVPVGLCRPSATLRNAARRGQKPHSGSGSYGSRNCGGAARPWILSLPGEAAASDMR